MQPNKSVRESAVDLLKQATRRREYLQSLVRGMPLAVDPSAVSARGLAGEATANSLASFPHPERKANHREQMLAFLLRSDTEGRTPFQQREPVSPSITTMSRRYPTLPTGHPGPAHHLPHHLTQEAQSTESNGSTDSINTQVPLPYHLQGYDDSAVRPWATPDLAQDPTIGSFASSSKLNSSSDSNVPAGYTASGTASGSGSASAPQFTGSNSILPGNQSFDSHSSMQSSAWTQNNRVVADSRDSSFSSGMVMSSQNSYSGSNYGQQPRFSGGMHGPSLGSIPANGPYGYASTSGPSNSLTGGTHQHGGYPPAMNTTFPGQHSEYGSQGYGSQGYGSAPPAMNSYAPAYGPTATQVTTPYGPEGTPYPAPAVAQPNYNAYQGMPGQQMSYNSSSMISPAMSYSTMANSPAQNFQSTVYTDTTNQGSARAWGSIFDNDTTKKFMGQSIGYGMSGVSNYGPEAGGSSTNSQVDKGKGKERASSISHGRLSTYSAPPVTYDNHKGKSRERNPSTEPEEHVEKPSGTEHIVSGLSAQPTLASEDTKANLDYPPTPGPNPRPLDIDFKSEPRFKEVTPHLRSGRSQTISSSAATDPVRKNAISNWLEKTPTNNPMKSGESSAAIRHHQGSPPKMELLTAMNSMSLSGPSGLTPVNENDPFVARRLTPLLRNPIILSSFGDPPSSKELHNLFRNGPPSIEEALKPEHLPFVEYCRLAKEDNYGVIKIKNIPYSVNRPEVLAFLGRNARIVNENENEPIHIIMERVTSKTLDCYVEFINFNEAVAAVERFEVNRSSGRGGRLGQRHVEIELSSQEALMKDLFPKAKNVQWKGAHPTIIPRDPNDIYNSGFQGFVSSEEMVMLVKHVETPQRSPFSKDCPQRPFECLISTLLKFPWHMVDYITIKDRSRIHEATKKLLNILVERVKSNNQDCNITSMLLKRVWKAALKCPGLSPLMKDDIVCIANLDDSIAREYGVAPFADWWGCLFTIGSKADAPADIVHWYVAVMREAMEKAKPRLSLAEQAALGPTDLTSGFWGDMAKYINHDKSVFHDVTLAAAAKTEWAAIERVLRMALEV